MHNLFLCGEGPDKPPKQVRPLARMIDQVDADVLILQEVGSLGSLEALNGKLVSPYRHLACPAGNSDRSIHVAVMSRRECVLTSHTHLVLQDAAGAPLLGPAVPGGEAVPLGLRRDLVRVEVAGLTLFGVHLKSKTNPDWQTLPADVVRSAECGVIAATLQSWLNDHPNQPCALLGDFNEVSSATSLAPLAGLVLRDPFAEPLRAAGRNPTTYWPKRRLRVDRILLNAAAERCLAVDSLQIHANHMARTASDHYPVSLRLNLKPDIH